MGDGSLTIEEMIKEKGLTVTGIAMLEQIAETLEYAEKAVIEGQARETTLTWLYAWRAQSTAICSGGE
jgi:hypothetical protein